MRAHRAVVLIVTVVLGPAAFGQVPVQLVIVSPAEGVYVSDRVTLEARIDPRERRDEIADVTFFADGKQVCRSTDVEAPKCSWDAGARIQAHTIRVVATARNGDRIVATARTRAIDVKESVSISVVQINALVSDRGGAFVRGLAPEQFRVTEDGVPQTIRYFAAEEAPLEIVVAMDISASMGAALDDLRTAVGAFLLRLRPEDQVTLVAFNDEMFPLTQRETDQALRIQALDRLAAYGGTRLYDAIIYSLDLLSRRQGRRCVIIFSDGEDQSSQATFAHVDHALKGSDAVLFMVGLGRGREQATLRETLEALAEPSGGRALFAERPADLGDRFAELRTELAQQYLVGYESSNSAQDGAWRKLTVDIPGTSYRVRARRGYFAPTP